MNQSEFDAILEGIDVNNLPPLPPEMDAGIQANLRMLEIGDGVSGHRSALTLVFENQDLWDIADEATLRARLLDLLMKAATPALIFCMLFLSACTLPATEKKDEASAMSAVSSVGTWLTFENPEYPYSIEYPEDWIVDAQHPDGVLIEAPGNTHDGREAMRQGPGESILFRHQLAVMVNREQTLAQAIASYGEMYPEGCKRKVPLTIDGIKGATLFCISSFDGMEQEVVLLPDQKNVYILTRTSKQSYPGDEILVKMIHSFRIRKR